MRLLPWGAAVLLAGAGCSGAPVEPPPPASVTPPAWLHTLPNPGGEVCAVGISGPTYYAEDARANSKAQALSELSRAREVKVTSEMTMSASGNSRDSDTSVVEKAGFVSEAVLKSAVMREQWVHPGGDRKLGEKGTVYTLVCMPAR